MKIDYRIFPFSLLLIMLALIITGFLNTSTLDIRNLFSDREFIYSVWFSLKTSFSATLLAVLMGLPTGLYLSRNNTFTAKVIDVFTDIPMIIPPLITGVLLISFFKSSGIDKFYSFIFTTSGAVAAQFVVSLPLVIKSAKSSFSMVPETYEIIAMTLGSKPLKAFYDTTFRLALPGILSGTTLAFLRCMGEFGATLIIGGGIPYKTENIPINIYINISSGNFSAGMAASILSVIIVTLIIIIIKTLTSGRKRNER